MQQLQIPESLSQWVDANSPEIAAIGGLQSIEVRVVDKLPFWFTSSKIDGQVWGEVIYLKREWFDQYRNPMAPNELPLTDRFLHLFFHELYHPVSQRKFWGPFWCWLLFHYLFGHRKEEKAANDFRDALYEKWVTRGH